MFEKVDGDGSYPVHMLLRERCVVSEGGLRVAREVIKILLEACPSSGRHMLKGRTALHLAVANGWPCHDLLLALHPESLDMRDPSTKLYPFQTAAIRSTEQSAVGKVDTSSCSLDVTYELFRANPTHAKAIAIK